MDIQKIGAILVCLLAGCAGSGARQGTHLPKNSSRALEETEKPALISFASDREPIALIVRELHAQTGHNVVVMNGLELYEAGPFAEEWISPRGILERMAGEHGAVVGRGHGYDILFPADYASILDLTLEDILEPALARRTANARFGSDTPLYSVLALLGHTLNTTLVADQVVGAVETGEVQLRDATVQTILEAVLQSARVSQGAFRVISNSSFTFFYAPGNRPRENLLLNTQPLTAPQRALLERRVDLTLPTPSEDPNHLKGYFGAVSLSECLQSAGEQVGVALTADNATRMLPVNPVVMRNVTLRTALRLLIRQWPIPIYGYLVEDDAIRIVRAPS